ncbi:MAG: TM2 domain-containing protein [Flavobacteriaceae bacterium]|nr:TM2 domain-containing protein [Flavobacteriaceae bacterium]
MINKFLAYVLLIFPITGVLGFHQFYIGNFKKGILRILTSPLFAFLWFYDLFNFKKDLKIAIENELNNFNEIIKLLDEGKLGKALKLFIKKGKTQIYVREIIKRGQGDVIVKHFSDNEEDKKELEKLISNGDTESLVVYLSAYYLKMKSKQILN